MKVGSAVLRAFPIPAVFFTRRMVATRGQRAVTTTPIGSIEFDFSILVLVLLLANDFMCFACVRRRRSPLPKSMGPWVNGKKEPLTHPQVCQPCSASCKPP